jgi:hypothetical protein
MAGLGTNYVFAFNDWLFGGPGQGVQILDIDGLEDLPNLRVQDDNRGYQDGMFTGRDFLDGRYITMHLQIMTTGNTVAESMPTYLAQLKTNMSSQQYGTGTLQFTLPGRGIQRVYARVRKRTITIDPNYTYGKALASIQLFCPDPRIYDDAAQTTSLSTYGDKGRTYGTSPSYSGFTYGASPYLGWSYDTTITGFSPRYADLPNAGNTPSYPIIQIQGPCTNPSVTQGGNFLTINTTLGATDIVSIDTLNRTIDVNGIPSRNLLTTSSRWFNLPPGTSTVGYSAATATSASTAKFTWRNAYI